MGSSVMDLVCRVPVGQTLQRGLQVSVHTVKRWPLTCIRIPVQYIYSNYYQTLKKPNVNVSCCYFRVEKINPFFCYGH